MTNPPQPDHLKQIALRVNDLLGNDEMIQDYIDSRIKLEHPGIYAGHTRDEDHEELYYSLVTQVTLDILSRVMSDLRIARLGVSK